MSIQSVEAAASRVADAERALASHVGAMKAEMEAAKTAGVPVAAVARAAGVSRQTAIKWLGLAARSPRLGG